MNIQTVVTASKYLRVVLMTTFADEAPDAVSFLSVVGAISTVLRVTDVADVLTSLPVVGSAVTVVSVHASCLL